MKYFAFCLGGAVTLAAPRGSLDNGIIVWLSVNLREVECIRTLPDEDLLFEDKALRRCSPAL